MWERVDRRFGTIIRPTQPRLKCVGGSVLQPWERVNNYNMFMLMVMHINSY